MFPLFFWLSSLPSFSYSLSYFLVSRSPFLYFLFHFYLQVFSSFCFTILWFLIRGSFIQFASSNCFHRSSFVFIIFLISFLFHFLISNVVFCWFIMFCTLFSFHFYLFFSYFRMGNLSSLNCSYSSLIILYHQSIIYPPLFFGSLSTYFFLIRIVLSFFRHSCNLHFFWGCFFVLSSSSFVFQTSVFSSSFRFLLLLFFLICGWMFFVLSFFTFLF